MKIMRLEFFIQSNSQNDPARINAKEVKTKNILDKNK